MTLLSNGKTITKELVEKKYRLVNVDARVEKMLSLLKEKDREKAFKLIAELMENGIDIKYFLEQLIQRVHENLLENVGVLEKREGTKFELEEIKRLANLLSKAYLETKTSLLEQMPLELLVVEWTEENEGEVLPHIEGDVQESKSQGKVSSPSLNESRLTGKNLNKNLGEKPAANSKTDKLFMELIEKVNEHNRSVAGFLRGCSIKSFESGKLTLETGYKFHKEKLEDAKTMKVLEQVMEEINGNKVDIIILLK